MLALLSFSQSTRHPAPGRGSAARVDFGQGSASTLRAASRICSSVTSLVDRPDSRVTALVSRAVVKCREVAVPRRACARHDPITFGRPGSGQSESREITPSVDPHRLIELCQLLPASSAVAARSERGAPARQGKVSSTSVNVGGRVIVASEQLGDIVPDQSPSPANAFGQIVEVFGWPWPHRRDPAARGLP